jgi:histidine triad (HIT) family protein
MLSVMTAEKDADCLFCKIVAGEIPGDVVHETETTLAFRDIDPKAPTHVLVIPRSHHRDVAALTAAEPRTAVDVLAAATEVAAQEGLDEGYRLVFNTGGHGGQAVFHVHAHVLGGRQMAWPPG